jgi:predicted nucleic acid-binding protein
MASELAAQSPRPAEGVLIDSKLLLLLLVGTYRRNLVGKFKRIQEYSKEDFDLLVEFVSQFVKVVTSPMILTEVNGLANQLENRFKPDFYEVFKNYGSGLFEETRPSREILATEHFKRFGYTDASLVLIAEQKYVVLTDDLALHAYLQQISVNSLNFNHIRSRTLGL